MIKQAELQEAYSLGRQAALEKIAAPKWYERWRMNRKIKAAYRDELKGRYPFPTQKEKDLIYNHVGDVSAGIYPKKIGKVPVVTASYEMLDKHPWNLPEADAIVKDSKILDSRVGMSHPYVHNRRIEYKGKPASRPAYTSESFIDLNRDWKDSNNPLNVAHEYYHARPNRNIKWNLYTKSEKPDTPIPRQSPRDEEHYADIFASLTDYSLWDTAEQYLTTFGGRAYPPVPGDNHLDDQARLRLFAGMAR